ncbi:thiaminase II [Telmatospirillum sp. J64-1]|uniref:thiaminase II n=1 Tax=Telmatospirillum sp. J64-1 TaxID=2502183 RepID=UPI00115C766D|nr:thiaminase II [Telmatospirillum sp. J64-1]
MAQDDAADSLFARLRAACEEDWCAFVEHDFVRRLGEGSLPEECFRHYLGQDYLFLIHFARAYALAVYKSETLEDMRQAASGMAAILDEMGLHVRYCQNWGLSKDEMQSLPEARATMAYTRFVLEKGMAGDLLDLHVALAPCIIGYGEIANRLKQDFGDKIASNPYGDWIETYAGEAYQDVARAQIEQLDRLFARRAGPGRMDSLVATFRTATRLETDFWEMGLSLAA